jgi:hypothetical protein
MFTSLQSSETPSVHAGALSVVSAAAGVFLTS